jgi:hypothetical protein
MCKNLREVEDNCNALPYLLGRVAIGRRDADIMEIVIDRANRFSPGATAIRLTLGSPQFVLHSEAALICSFT